MNPIMIHADGTDCYHGGMPQATVSDEGGPLCPYGRPITHIRFNGRVLTLDEALCALQSIADAFTSAIMPLIENLSAAFAEVGSAMMNDSRIRVLAAVLAEAERERERELR